MQKKPLSADTASTGTASTGTATSIEQLLVNDMLTEIAAQCDSIQTLGRFAQCARRMLGLFKPILTAKELLLSAVDANVNNDFSKLLAQVTPQNASQLLLQRSPVVELNKRKWNSVSVVEILAFFGDIPLLNEALDKIPLPLMPLALQQ